MIYFLTISRFRDRIEELLKVKRGVYKNVCLEHNKGILWEIHRRDQKQSGHDIIDIREYRHKIKASRQETEIFKERRL